MSKMIQDTGAQMAAAAIGQKANALVLTGSRNSQGEYAEEVEDISASTFTNANAVKSNPKPNGRQRSHVTIGSI